MSTQYLRKVGHILMIAGSVVFFGGAGLCIASRCIDYNEFKLLDDKNKLQIESDLKKTELETAKEIRDKAKKMSPTEFAKFKAEKEASLSAEAKLEVAKAKADSATEITKTKLECEERIIKIEKERKEAIEKYEMLQKLFDNRDEILEARDELKRAAKVEEAATKTKDKVRSFVISLDD